MKLLFFISSMRGGGAERVMAVLTDELVKRGHQVTLIVMSSDPSFYPVNESVDLLYVKGKKINSKLSRFTNILDSLKTIRKIIEHKKPDIIITFNYAINARVLISSLFLKIPVIASEHFTFDTKLSLKKKFQRYQVNKLADKVTILTQYDYEYIGNKLKNKIVMPNPLPFTPLSEYNNDREKSIIAAGSINRWHHKGFDNLVQIWGGIAKQYPEWKLYIAGSGSDKNKVYLNELANEYNLSSQFVLLGEVNNLDSILSESSIFVLSSRHEGLPMVLIEAMSQGCACVSFHCKTGPSEIITHNVDGILVEDQNREAMQEALSDLIENNEKREALARHAIQSVDRFSLKNIADKWETLFNEVYRA